MRLAGVEPARHYIDGFSYHYSFHYQIALFVVWTIPSPYRSILGARRLVSTPSLSLFANGAWLGISILQPSPNLTGSTSTVSRRALKLSKSVAATNYATVANFLLALYRQFLICQHFFVFFYLFYQPTFYHVLQPWLTL